MLVYLQANWSPPGLRWESFRPDLISQPQWKVLPKQHDFWLLYLKWKRNGYKITLCSTRSFPVPPISHEVKNTTHTTKHTHRKMFIYKSCEVDVSKETKWSVTFCKVLLMLKWYSIKNKLIFKNISDHVSIKRLHISHKSFNSEYQRPWHKKVLIVSILDLPSNQAWLDNRALFPGVYANLRI